MRGEQLDKRITIQYLTKTPDGGGGYVPAWITFATIWATKAHQASREFYSAQKLKAETTDVFTGRYLAGVTTAMRVSWDGRTFEIIGAPADRRKDELILSCKETI